MLAIEVVAVCPAAKVLAVRVVAKALVEVEVVKEEAPVTERPVSVPTLVSEDAVTLLARVVPVRVPAGATTATELAAVSCP